jgi:dihydroorotate dehydrogenase electron transfer subunit
MSNPLHAPYYADGACWTRATILENMAVARDTHRVRFVCPPIAARTTPGQFIMLRLAGCDDPLLGRPLALYDTVFSSTGDVTAMDVVYLVAGKLTSRLAGYKPGQSVEVWGPLGNGFPPQIADHLIMVAGGIGQTPFLALAAEHAGRKSYGRPARRVPNPKRITLCYGARSKPYLAGVDDFQKLGVEVRLSTDDGTAGHRGFVTDVLRQLLDEEVASPNPQTTNDPGQKAAIVCCGPEPMMAAVAEIAQEHSMPCQVSLETPMACGIGICFTCVAKVRQPDGSWDYKRTCVEGPVFAAEQIAW